MRKFIIGIMAVAMLAIIPAAASADVQRCAVPVITTGTTITTATFQVTQVRGEGGTWIQDFTVKVQPNGDFAGTAHQYSSENGPTGSDAFDETVTGKFSSVENGVANTVTMIVDRDFNVVDEWQIIGAKMDGTTPNVATSYPTVTWQLDMFVTAPVFKTDTTTTPGTESVKNHGQYVKAMGSGKTAAQACPGMPLNSTQGS